ncbi:nuclease-related domain-containing protein [Ferviditalea candida]|uniref:Nuclease-related domain-containing protein n=1 Tax=Ferviditalea candida TaxID=3108399 RepID=A0ABU5ZI26_9BACL|nr:nuclease-related domain-containing protein [Paenibacillaceae bacterium T2]
MDKKKGIKQAGISGEKAVAHQLKFLGSEYKILNSKMICSGGSCQQFDHVVVGPNGIFHIETKYWSGQIAFTETGIERDGGRGTKNDPTAQMYRHEYILKELVRENGLAGDVVGILCFAHPGCELIGSSPAFATVKLDRLVHFLKTHRAKKTLSDEEIRKILRVIEANSKSAG